MNSLSLSCDSESVYEVITLKEDCHDTAFCRDLFILGGVRSSGDFSSYN